MAINRAFLYWGIFFVAFGAVLVFVDVAGLDTELVADALRLWPLVVIAIGLGIVLRRTRLNLAGGMLAAAMPGLVLGGLIAAGPRVATTCAGTQAVALAQSQGTLADGAQVNLRLSCGEVTVDTASGQGWQLGAGNADGIPASIRASATGLSIESGRSDNWFGTHAGPDVWNLTLPTDASLDLSAEVDAGRATLDLARARLGNVSLVVNAAEAHVDLTTASLHQLSATLNAGAVSLSLPAAEDIQGSVSVNAGALKVCAAPGLGLRVHSTATLGAATYPGLIQNGSAWESPDYATAPHRADLTVTVNVGSVHLNPNGGCL